jgi:hypothetical protein
MKLGIRKVKTFNGLKYGVIDVNTKLNLDVKKGEKPKYTVNDVDVIEVKNGIALFDYNEDGLNKARKLKTELSK